ncbi:hypothetical protein FVA74_00350 [Salinibacterium sp. dk2585]|uniref:hypothetical protein n=1 Tax=unclassified Salinibacterium TaxID=2632331 RepID=UPI0011C24AB1|nr:MULTISPECIES: hypothetical protein [unclassified Salinibacterium]QEE60179.1 hypothetical protein FVA74_00350 [Salinibacterium sp. dk2585]TXK55251.1 hypothetical protein FVP63_00495 [Salinibacterium sp. dk5596]
MPDTSFDAWVAALDELERELEWADDVVSGRGAQWTPPQGLGRMPAELVDRATRILDAQRNLMTRLDEERQDVGRHIAALRSVPAVTDAAASVYLDVAG